MRRAAASSPLYVPFEGPVGTLYAELVERTEPSAAYCREPRVVGAARKTWVRRVLVPAPL